LEMLKIDLELLQWSLF